jgi:predicted nucleic acid-binding protein
MLVVADASPINILIRIGHIDILGILFSRVVIPPVVAAEMSHESTPSVVRGWLAQRPPWLEIRAPTFVDDTIDVDQGERDAICLARELRADLLLVDDQAGRKAAASLGLPVTGTLGVLERAAALELLSLSDAIDRLRRTDFRISEAILEQALWREAERGKGSK